MKKIAIFGLLIAINVLFMPFLAEAKLVSKTVEYKDKGGVVMEGYFVYDDIYKGKRPAVIVVHEWWGLNDYVKKRADMLAQKGYGAFAADIYGKGNRAKTMEEASHFSTLYNKDRNLMSKRLLAALKAVKKQKHVDKKNIAAIGYCFGGGAVLELARITDEVKAVVSFHGGLNNPEPEKSKNIKAEVLVFHGGDDKFISPEAVSAFKEEMKSAGVKWQLVEFGGAVHSFTNFTLDSDPTKPMAYNERADKRSWQIMSDLFSEVLERK